MSDISINNGFVVKTDENGRIVDVKTDGLTNLQAGEYLSTYLDPASLGKILSFLMEVKTQGSVLGWEVNMKLGKTLQSLHIAGFKEDGHLYIVGSTNVEETRRYYNDLMIMNNQQTNQIRELMKKNVASDNAIEEAENSFNELMKINNEMINLQRELTRKNHKLNQLNDELEAKNKELDQFAYIVSHDLKAPLRGISSLINMIEEDYAEELDDDLKYTFGLITSRAKRMNELISGILSYARAGKMDTDISTFNLDDLLKELLDAIAPPKTFNFIFPEQLPNMTCSYVQLSQVLTNLLGNAVKYHHESSGNIELKIDELEEGNGLLRFSVIDDGPGIPEKYQTKVFETFGTANEKSRTDSTGIGLAIVKKLVEQHGGEIGLISEVGKGSTFWFTWPKVVEEDL